MPILSVGPGQTYATISAAIAASQDGDVIQVQAGTYTDDFAIINTKVTIEGVGGMAHLVGASEPGNGKGIFVINNDVTLNNLEFSGAHVGDGNGAGIRYQAGNLVINNCFFHDNQDGLLGTPFNADTGSITIINSEFKHNGAGDGFTHNLYVGQVGTLDITGSFFHDAVVGHEIKSLASNTIIENSTIVDGLLGTASYSIDLPDGGNATISNNLIEQGPNSENPAILSVGESGKIYPGSSVSITHNTILNDLLGNNNVRVIYNDNNVPISFIDNSVFGVTEAMIALNPPITESGTNFLTVEPAFACFAKGTRIHTDHGEIPVEALRVGDHVAALFGAPDQPVIWIGERRVDCRRHPSRKHIWPILVFAAAFGPGRPRRNLWLSPEHAVYICDVLIPVRLLVNHRSIVQVPMSTVTYYHVELARHDVLMADGLPCESYLDTGNRASFANAGSVITLHPEFALRQWEAKGCAPLVFTGPTLEAARRQVNAMAADAASG